jgi:hypothetical protein
MPLPLYMTVASLFVQAGAALIIACVFVGLQRRYWRPFLRHWTRSWLALAAYTAFSAVARIVLVGRTIEFVPHAAIAVMSGVAGCLQLAWLLLGTFELTSGKPLPRETVRRIVIGTALFGALLPALFWWDASNAELVYQLRVTSRRVLVALAALVAARSISRAPRIARAIGRRSVTLAFFGIAAHQVHFLALSTDRDIRALNPLWLASLGLVDVVLYFGLAMGLVIWLLEEERQATMDAAAKIEKIAYHDALTGLPNRQLFLNQMGWRSTGRAERTASSRCSSSTSTGSRCQRLARPRGGRPAPADGRGAHPLGGAGRGLGDEAGRRRVRRVVHRRAVARTTPCWWRSASSPREASDLLEGRKCSSPPASASACIPRRDPAGRAVEERRRGDVPREGAGPRHRRALRPGARRGRARAARLESHLQRAVEHDQMRVYYQPIVDSGTGRITGRSAAALESSRAGHAPPRSSSAGRGDGRDRADGEWVLREACRQVAAVARARQPQLRGAVNLSVSSCSRPISSHESSRCSTRRDCLPTSSRSRSREHRDALQRPRDRQPARLKAKGVRVSIDDLGPDTLPSALFACSRSTRSRSTGAS